MDDYRQIILGAEPGQIVPIVKRIEMTEPVDFLKMNIEGTEWGVLADCKARLRWVREMVIEYHLPRRMIPSE